MTTRGAFDVENGEAETRVDVLDRPVDLDRDTGRIPSVVDQESAVSSSSSVPGDDLPLGSMYHVVDQIGARTLWAQGITGAGVNVAVIDTGVTEVTSLTGADKIVAVADLTSEVADPTTRFVDTNGHGTHMAGIIAGREPGVDPGVAGDHPEKFVGVAPDAGIVSVKVSGRDGSTELDTVIAGIDWTIAHAVELGIRVINLSYKSGSPLPYRHDPLTAAVERAWNAGIVVVAIAGNDGMSAKGLVSPGVDPFIITVAGAEPTDDGIRIAEWSNRGDGIRNPDLAAPGAHIHSLRAPGSDADLNHSDVGYVDDVTFKGTGTSQSAAVTSGAVALYLQAHPEATPDQVKAALTSTASLMSGESAASAGHGLLRIDAAVAAPVCDFVQEWPTATFYPIADTTSVVSARCDTASWGGASWGGASWGGASWGGASWGGASWGGASWGGASWGGASWGGASWGGASWGGASWGGASWGGASWGGASWGGASWGGASWGGASWGGASWGGASWGGASWGGASWGGASWGGASWGGASWGGASWG